VRAKLQYSVELDEVPKETRRLFSRANGEIRDAGDHMDDIFAIMESSTDYENVLDSVKSARLNLAEADFRLGDAEAILHGYMHAKYASKQEKPEALKNALPDAEGEQDEQL
jgi:hypothetical protein